MKMVSAIFFWLKIYVCSGAIKAEQNTSLTRRNAYNWNPKISVNPSSILQARFGEINPDMPYLCRRGLSGPEKSVFAFSPLFGESR